MLKTAFSISVVINLVAIFFAFQFYTSPKANQIEVESDTVIFKNITSQTDCLLIAELFNNNNLTPYSLLNVELTGASNWSNTYKCTVKTPLGDTVDFLVECANVIEENKRTARLSCFRYVSENYNASRSNAVSDEDWENFIKNGINKKNVEIRTPGTNSKKK